MKNKVFTAVAVGLLYCFVELTCFAVFSYRFGSLISLNDIKTMRNDALADSGDILAEGIMRQASVEASPIHPYTGYTSEPGFRDMVDDYGYYNQGTLFGKKSDSVVRIGILGGSVARGFGVELAHGGVIEFRKVFARSEQFRDKEIVVVNMAIGGYKQPQQLMTLNYLLSLGVELDLVINLDGFNDIVLPVTDNLPLGISPVYPRNWSKLSEKAPDQKLQYYISDVIQAKERRGGYARFFSFFPLDSSYAASLVWKYFDRRAYLSYAEGQRAIQSYFASELNKSFHIAGPKFPYSTPDEIYSWLANYWRRSSRLLADVCVGEGIPYYHFLQPNQYVEGAKELTDEEKTKAYDLTNPYALVARKGYGYLLAEGKKLQENGVHFTSLHDAFLKSEQTLYADTCCHFNEAGNDIIGAVMAKAIIQKGL